MDNENTYKESSYSDRPSREHMDRKRPFKEATPEEVKRAVKENVQKGVAAAAGAVEGFAEEMEKDDVAETTGRAIEQVGQTTQKIAESTRKAAQQTKEAIQGKSKTDGLADGSSLGDAGGSGLDRPHGASDDEDISTRF